MPELKLPTDSTPKIIIGRKKGIDKKINRGPLVEAPKVNAAIGIPMRLNNGVPNNNEKNNPKISLEDPLRKTKKMGDKNIIGNPVKVQWLIHLVATIIEKGILLILYWSNIPLW